MTSVASPAHQRLLANLARFTAVAAVLACVVGLLVLSGWAVNAPLLRSLWPGLPPMRPLTAVSFVLAGLALWLLRREGVSLTAARLARVVALVTVLIGGLSLVEDLLSLDLGFDRWLFPGALVALGPDFVPRMAPGTAACLTLLGVGLYFLDDQRARRIPYAAYLIFFISLLALIGYLYDAPILYQPGDFAPMAMNSAVVFVALSLGLLAARPRRPTVSTITSLFTGGEVARRLLPAAILAPIGLGWLGLMGVMLGWYDALTGLALYTGSLVVVFVVLVLVTARLINRVDTARDQLLDELRQSEEAVRALNATLEQRVAQRTAELHANEATLAGLFDVLPVGVSIMDKERHVVDTNQALEGILRLSSTGIKHGQYGQRQYIHADGRPLEPHEFPSLIALREQRPIHDFEMGVVLETGQIVWTNVSAAPLNVGDLGAVIVTTDITARKAVEAALEQERDRLRDNEAKLAALFEVLPVGVYMLDQARQVVDANKALESILHVTREGLMRGAYNHRRVLHPDGRLVNPADMPSARAYDQHVTLRDVEIGVEMEDGEVVWTNVSAAPLDVADLRAVVVIGDLTARKQAEAKVQASLREKEALLKEIHHRVKNNLQIISSLLRLQADSLSDAAARVLFLESQRRVRSMALIHEQLYRSADLVNIEFGGYVNSLVASLRRSAADDLSLVPIHIEVDPIHLEIDQAMPLGLIINELVTNSLKHAFGPHPPEDAALWLHMAAAPPGSYTLTIRDNGRGIPDSVDFEQPVSMGLQLVQSFVLQLRGQLTVQRRPSAAFTIVIPEASSPHG